MNDIIITKQAGGLNRTLPGEDHVSAILMYLATLPAGFSTSAREKTIYSVSEAEDLGIAKGSSNYGVLHYHISEYFRMQPNGELWIGLYSVPVGTYDFAELATLQRAANGRIRQAAIFTPELTFATSQVTAIQTVCTTLYNEHKPLVVVYAADTSAISDLATLADLKALTADSVAVVIGQDAGGEGADLFDSTDKSVTCIGAVLGALSASAVHENIGWIGKFNFSNGAELETLSLATSGAPLIKAQTESLLTAICDKGYIFLRKHIGILGSYANDSFTAVAATSDYAYLENQRTIQKAVRSLRTYLLPDLSGPLSLKTDGTLSPATAAHFESLCQQALDQLKRNGEISAYKANVNPAQNVLSTSQLVVGVQIIPVGVARTIQVNIGFTTSIS
jgi:hypothetical protein